MPDLEDFLPAPPPYLPLPQGILGIARHPYPPEAYFVPGDKVNHWLYGSGMVEDFKYRDDEWRVVIQFDNPVHGTKIFLAAVPYTISGGVKNLGEEYAERMAKVGEYVESKEVIAERRKMMGLPPEGELPRPKHLQVYHKDYGPGVKVTEKEVWSIKGRFWEIIVVFDDPEHGRKVFVADLVPTGELNPPATGDISYLTLIGGAK